MTDPREMLARLNPTNVRFDVGRGGGNPELTNIDIAGALGMVPAGLGRDLMEHLHGPDPMGPVLDRVFSGIQDLVNEQASQQLEAYFNARTKYGARKARALWDKDHSTSAEVELAILYGKMKSAEYSCWPESLSERLPALVVLVIAHMRGFQLSNRKKAKLLRVDESTYRDSWWKIYEWVLTQAIEAEQQAAQAFGGTLRREVA
ncbi:MAG: hypothetical protein ACN6O2_01320 [Stenotrophomonas sp.]